MIDCNKKKKNEKVKEGVGYQIYNVMKGELYGLSQGTNIIIQIKK